MRFSANSMAELGLESTVERHIKRIPGPQELISKWICSRGAPGAYPSNTTHIRQH